MTASTAGMMSAAQIYSTTTGTASGERCFNHHKLSGFWESGSMADQAGLRVIGLAFSTVTAVVMLLAAMTVTTSMGMP